MVGEDRTADKEGVCASGYRIEICRLEATDGCLVHVDHSSFLISYLLLGTYLPDVLLPVSLYAARPVDFLVSELGCLGKCRGRRVQDLVSKGLGITSRDPLQGLLFRVRSPP